MLAHPIPINRPFVVSDLGTRLCRPSELVLAILPPVTTPFTREGGKMVLHRQGRRRQVARQYLPEQRKKWVKPFQILRPLSSQSPLDPSGPGMQRRKVRSRVRLAHADVHRKQPCWTSQGQKRHTEQALPKTPQ